MPKEMIAIRHVDDAENHIDSLHVAWGRRGDHPDAPDGWVNQGFIEVQIDQDYLHHGQRIGVSLTAEEAERMERLLRRARHGLNRDATPQPTIAVVASVLPTAERWIASQEDPSLYFAVTPFSARRMDGRKITDMVDLRDPNEPPSEGMRHYHEALTATLRRQIARYKP